MSHPTPSPSKEFLANKVPNQTPQSFKLIDKPFDPPDEVGQRSREFIAKVKWVFAKTMPQWPHEYVVRDRIVKQGSELEAEYDRLWQDILDHGYRGRFGRNVNRYLTVDGWRYWSCAIVNCTAPATSRPCQHAWRGVGCVINRALNDDLPEVCCSLGEVTRGQFHAKTCVNYKP